MVDEFEVGTSILDIPLGTGRFLQCYEKGEHFVIGVDKSKDMLLQAKKKAANSNLVQMMLGEAEHIPLGDKSVDYAICIRLFNWVPQLVLKQMLIELQRVAKKRYAGCYSHTK